MSVAPTPLPTNPKAHRDGPWVVVGIVAISMLAATAVVVLAATGVFEGSSTTTPVQGSGVAASQTRDVAPFNALSLSGANDIRVLVGGPQSVVAGVGTILYGASPAQVTKSVTGQGAITSR
jgi:hypothetical protein